MEKKYIVSVDFGHGETSAWIVPIHDDTDGYALRIRNGVTNERVCPSWVYKEGDNYSISRGSLIRFGFKDKPSVLDSKPEKKQAYANFAKLIIQALLQNNAELKIEDGESNFILCVACPAIWSESETEKKNYLDFFSQAIGDLGIVPDRVINENVAAFYTWRSNSMIQAAPNLDLEANGNGCTLVIDYGSRAIDYVVIKDGKILSDENWSNPQLGAGMVEMSIINDYREKTHDTAYQAAMKAMADECVRIGKSHYNQKEIELFLLKDTRKAKEAVFDDGTWPSMNIMKFSMFDKCGGGDSGYNTGIDKIEISGKMTGMHHFKGYQDSVKNDFIRIRNKINDEIGTDALKHIILSGGACKMTWLMPMLQDVFQNVDVVKDADNSAYNVSKGVAIYTRDHLKALDDLHNAVRKIPFETIYKDAVYKAWVKAVNEKVQQDVIRSIIDTKGMTGVSIRKKFCDFVRKINEERLHQQECLDEEISVAIGEVVKKVVASNFNVDINTNNITVQVEVEKYKMVENNFEKSGAIYNNFTRWIDDASGRFWGLDFNEVLNGEKRERIARSVSENLISYFQGRNMLVFNSINSIAESLKSEAERAVDEVFLSEDKQLFKTAFMID